MDLSPLITVLSGQDGQIRPGGAQGVVHAGRRVLAEAVLEVAGAEPVPVSHGLLGARKAVFTATPAALPFTQVERQRQREAGPGVVRERIAVTSTAGYPVTADIALRVTAGQLEVRHIQPHQGRQPGSGGALPPSPLAGWHGRQGPGRRG